MSRSNKKRKKVNNKKRKNNTFAAAVGATNINNQKNSIRIHRRECLGQPSTTAGMDFDEGLRKYRLNPADPVTFPWLSQMAPLFETYQFLKLRFTLEFLNPTDVVGRFIAAIDYDAADANPGSEIDLLNFQGAVSGPVWGTHYVDAKIQNLTKRKTFFTQRHAPSDTTERRQTDAGNLFMYVAIASVNYRPMIWVEYDVLFQTPQIPNSSDACLVEWTYTEHGIDDTNQFNQTSYTGGDDAPLVEPSARLVDTVDSDSWYMRAGKYLLHRFAGEIGGTVSNIAVPTTSGANSVINLSNGLYSSTGAEGMIISLLDVQDENVPFDVGGDTSVSGLDYSRMLLQPIGDALYDLLWKGVGHVIFKAL